MTERVDVVIVNWNAGRQLRDCVVSIEEHGFPCVGRVVVVDNGSSDSSVPQISDLSFVDLILAGENLGFAKACNAGAERCEAEFLLFLNPDARLMEGTIARVLSFMDSDMARNVGICGVRLLDENGRVQRHCARFPTLFTYLGHSTGLSVLFPAWFRGLFMDDFDHLSSRDVDHVIGAFFLVRRELFVRINGFDERYFVYLEDLDFSLRARESNWRTFYLADAVAFHKGGGTTDRVKAVRLFYSLRSRMLYAFRHFTPSAAWGVVGLTMLVEPWSRLLRAAVRRSWQETWDTCRGYGMLWRSLPETLKKSMSRG